MNYEMLRDIVAARRNAFAFAAFLAVLNLALVLYLSLWQKPELAKAQSEWFARREALATGKSLGSAATYREALRDLALFEERLIPKKEYAAFLGDMYETARRNSLSMKGFTYKPTVLENEGIISYGISFTVSGTYPAVKRFIAELASHPSMVTLDSVSLNSSSKTEEVVELKVQMTAYLKTEGE